MPRHGREAAFAVLLCAFAGLLYLPSIRCGFINLDDFQYVLDNPYLHQLSLQKLWWFFSEWRNPSTVGGYYQPLAMASLMLDRLFEGANKPAPFIYHLTNVILHMANTALVFLWLRLFVGAMPALLAAALFAVHPMNVESVTWIAQRKGLLAAFFSLGVLLAYHRHVCRRGRRALLAATILYALALLSKPTSWSLPAFLLLLDVWPYRRWSRLAVLEKTPMIVMSLLSGWVAYVSQEAGLGAAVPENRADLATTLLIMCENVTFYFRKLSWPAVLSPQYPAPPLSEIRLTSQPFATGVIGVALLLAILIVFRRRRAICVCILGFIVLINPVVLGAIRFAHALHADRFVYLPMAALLLGGAVGLERLRMRSRLVCACVVGTAIAAMSWKTVNQQAVWTDSVTYWNHVVALYPDDSFCREGLGRAWLALDEFDRAEADFREALRLNPQREQPYIMLGHVLLERNRPQEALEWLRRGCSIKPADAECNFFTGLALARLGRYAEAIAPDRTAVDARPSWPEALYNLANALLHTGRASEALPYYERLITLHPDNASYLYNFAVALLETHQDARAFPVLTEARHLNRAEPAILLAWASCAAAAGHVEEAWQSLEQAVKGRPDLLDRANRDPHFAAMRATARWARLEVMAEPR